MSSTRFLLGPAAFKSLTQTVNAIYEGKAKRLYETEDASALRMEFKDDATAFNAEKKSVFADKGRLNKAITLLLYKKLEKKGVPTHFIADLSETELLVRKVQILQIEVIVRNLAAGSFCKRTGIEEGHKFRRPIVEFSYKSDELGDPLINVDYAREMNLATPEECDFLKEQALVINNVLISFFEEAELRLVDFKIEFGKILGTEDIVLADEISPDTCRLWDIKTGKKLDKDRFRQDLGEVMEGYAEVLARLEQNS